MSKREKYLLTLIATAFVALLVLVIYSNYQKEADKEGGSGASDERKASVEKMESDYRADAQRVMDKYENLIQETDFAPDKMRSIRDEFIALHVPTVYKDVHLNLILAFDKLIAAAATGSNNDKLASMQLISEIQKNNTWLN